jgi:hypothetical protein
MTQLTSVQLIEAALWRELGSNEPQSADVLHQALADAVSRWLLIRSESPDIDALKFVCRVKANIDRPEPFLAVSNCGWSGTKGEGQPNSRESIPARD